MRCISTSGTKHSSMSLCSVYLTTFVILFVCCGLLLHHVSSESTSKPYCISHYEGETADLKVHHRKRQNHANCQKNDTYCGEWKDRTWNPVGCHYRDVSVDNARKCMTNRTIACIGDSQIRDLCANLAQFLSGITVEQAENHQYRPEVQMFTVADKFPLLESRPGEVALDPRNHIVFPSQKIRDETNYTWQVQIYFYVETPVIRDHVMDVLSNRLVSSRGPGVPEVKQIDFALWNVGAHEPKLFSEAPAGPKVYEHFVKQWLRYRNQTNIPTVWMSMNQRCEVKHHQQYKYQAELINDSNYYLHERLKREGLPYWDAASVQRTPDFCSHTDGVHVLQWVDVVRAQILLNHLCDEDWNWVGGIETFL